MTSDAQTAKGRAEGTAKNRKIKIKKKANKKPSKEKKPTSVYSMG